MGGKKVYVPNGKTNPTYRLTQAERLHVSILAHLGLWTNTSIAEAYGVTRKTVLNCVAKHPSPLPWSNSDEPMRSPRARLSAAHYPTA